MAAIPEELLKIDGITEVYSVTGDFDLITVVRVKHADDLAKIVTEQFANIKGINKTVTTVAFRCYSKYDLERMFS